MNLRILHEYAEIRTRKNRGYTMISLEHVTEASFTNPHPNTYTSNTYTPNTNIPNLYTQPTQLFYIANLYAQYYMDALIRDIN